MLILYCHLQIPPPPCHMMPLSAGDSSCHLSPVSFPWNCLCGKQENDPQSKLFAPYQLAQPSQRWSHYKPSSNSFATADLKMDTLIVKLVTKLVTKPQWGFAKILEESLFLFCRALNKAVFLFFQGAAHNIFINYLCFFYYFWILY